MIVEGSVGLYIVAAVTIVIGALAATAFLLTKVTAARGGRRETESKLADIEANLLETRARLDAALRESSRLASVDNALAAERARRESLEGQNLTLTTELGVSRAAELAAERALAGARESTRSLTEGRDEMAARASGLQNSLETLRAERDAALIVAADSRKDFEHATMLHSQTKQFLADAAKQLTTQFEAVSAQVLEQRGKALGEHHVERLGAVVQPLSQHLRALEEKLAVVENSRAEDRGTFVTMIRDLAAAQATLHAEASQLAKSLRGNVRVRGAWGETILDKALESSGLVEGRNYHKQASSRDEDDGRTMRPDVVVELPDNRSIVIDSKVSLSAYDRYVNADDEATAAQALIDHITAIRARIKELSEKNYAKAFGPSGLDFVLMFVPIEPALAVALQGRPELQTEALNRKVALVSPMTLHIALRTVEYLWRMDTLSNSMEQIITRGRLVHDEAVRLGEAVVRLEKSMNGSRDAFDDLRSRLTHPSNGIIRRAQELYKLGVAGKSKKQMPEQLAIAVDGGDRLTDADELPVDADLAHEGGETEASAVLFG